MLGAIFFFLWRRRHLRRARDSLIFDRTLTAAPRSVERGAGPPLTRTDSEILNDLLTSAYAHRNGQSLPAANPGSGNNFSNEKAGQVVTVLKRFPSSASNAERDGGVVDGSMDNTPN